MFTFHPCIGNGGTVRREIKMLSFGSVLISSKCINVSKFALFERVFFLLVAA